MLLWLAVALSHGATHAPLAPQPMFAGQVMTTCLVVQSRTSWRSVEQTTQPEAPAPSPFMNVLSASSPMGLRVASSSRSASPLWGPGGPASTANPWLLVPQAHVATTAANRAISIAMRRESMKRVYHSLRNGCRGGDRSTLRSALDLSTGLARRTPRGANERPPRRTGQLDCIDPWPVFTLPKNGQNSVMFAFDVLVPFSDRGFCDPSAQFTCA